MRRPPPRTLAFRHAVALCIGIVVGAGIFRVPALVADSASSEGALMLAWLAGGLLSLAGALCYAELAAAYPSTGGDYAFLRRAYGPRLACLYAWARLSVIQTGSLAMLALIFGDYLASLWPLGGAGNVVHAAALVVVLTALNWAGVRLGAEAQFWLTAIEVAGLCAIIAVGLTMPPAPPAPAPAGDGGPFGLMLVFVLLSYGGWSEVAYVAAELRGGRRAIARVLVVGLGAVTLLYLLVNWALLHGLGLAGMAGADAVAAGLMERGLGPAGAAAIGLAVAVAAVTSANGTAITGARSAAALGRDVGPLRWLGRWHAQRATPANALVLQGALALAIVFASAFWRDSFRAVLEYTAPVFWFFLLLVGLAQFILRRRDPDRERPFRTPLYPLVPAIFCATSLYLLYSSLSHTGASALVGVAVLAAGLVLLPFVAPDANEEVDR